MYQNKEKENNLIYYWTFWPQDSQLIAQNLEGIITLTYVYLKHNLAQRINIKEEKYLIYPICLLKFLLFKINAYLLVILS